MRSGSVIGVRSVARSVRHRLVVASGSTTTRTRPVSTWSPSRHVDLGHGARRWRRARRAPSSWPRAPPGAARPRPCRRRPPPPGPRRRASGPAPSPRRPGSPGTGKRSCSTRAERAVGPVDEGGRARPGRPGSGGSRRPTVRTTERRRDGSPPSTSTAASPSTSTSSTGVPAGPVEPVADVDRSRSPAVEGDLLRAATGCCGSPRGWSAAPAARPGAAAWPARAAATAWRRRRRRRPAGRPARSRPWRSRKPVSVSPATKPGWRRVRTSRSRLVVTPWMRARASVAGQGGGGLVPGGGVGDDLGQHGVVVGADHRCRDSTPLSTRDAGSPGGRPTSKRWRVPVEGSHRRAGSSA